MQTETVKATGKFKALVKDPPLAKFLFSDTRSAPLWLVVRVWLGLLWLSSGWGKAMFWDIGQSKWLSNGGVALKGYWDNALKVSPGNQGAIITYDWWYEYLKFMTTNQWYVWFAWVIALGEIAVGLGLITGTLTGIAAFFGTILNFSFLLAGTTSTNPLLFGTAIFVVLAWKTAGWWGLDRFILPALGTPWQPGTLFQRKPKLPAESETGKSPPLALN